MNIKNAKEWLVLIKDTINSVLDFKFVIIILIIVAGYTIAKVWGPDNRGEQALEAILKHEGIEIDFSPEK